MIVYHISDAKRVVIVNLNIWSVFFPNLSFLYSIFLSCWGLLCWWWSFLRQYDFWFSCIKLFLKCRTVCIFHSLFFVLLRAFVVMIFDLIWFFIFIHLTLFEMHNCTHITKNWNCLLLCLWKSFLYHNRQYLILSLLVEF